jgi:hypothetical protein
MMNDIAQSEPEIIIKGQPMDVISTVTDDHGVVWVAVEATEARLQRMRKSVRAAGLAYRDGEA